MTRAQLRYPEFRFAGLCSALTSRQRQNTQLKIDKSLLHRHQRSASTILRILHEHWREVAELQEIELLLLVEDYRDPQAILASQQLYRAGKDHLLIQCSTEEFLIGPYLRSGQAPCPSCLANRIESRAFARHTTRLLLGPPNNLGRRLDLPTKADICALATSGASYVASQKRIIGSDTIIEFRPEEAGERVHKLFPFPSCNCGDQIMKTRRQSAEISNEEEPLSLLESNLVGIIGDIRLAEITANLYVSIGSVGHPRRRSLSPLLAEGRGCTPGQARISCLAEAAERYSCMFRGTEKRLTNSYLALKDVAIHPNTLTLYSANQYEGRDVPGLQLAGVDSVPESFDESAEIDWTEAHCLDGSGMRLVPTSYCFLGHQDANHAKFCISDTNGCAAGITLNEAMVQALLELVERDACAIWWYNKVSRPEIDLSSLKDDRLLAWQTFFKHKKRSLWLLDVSTDLCVPVCAAISADMNDGDIRIGLGCHLDPATAVERAVTELTQYLFGAQYGRIHHSGAASALDQHCEEWTREVGLNNNPQLVGEGMIAIRRSAPDISNRSKTADHLLAVLSERIKGVGLQAYFVDLTRDDIEIPCVRVVVPGLRPLWRRLAPGRLYDVPVCLKWLSQPLSEENLNPITFMFPR